MAETQYEERTIKVNRVAKVVKGGRRFSFAALMVVGDGNGKVGLGYGKAKEAGLAVQEGSKRHARTSSTCPSRVPPSSIPSSAKAAPAASCSSRPRPVPASSRAARHILEMAGIRDILCKSLGSSNGINVAHATIDGLKHLRRPDEVATLRGKAPDEVTPGGVLRAWRERHRETDLYTAEAG